VRFPRFIPLLLPVLVLALLCRQSASAYSVLTHEQLIDLTWQDSIVPLLLSRYPNLTPLQLERARAYAYGGCVVQDMGYYPYGDRFYSNLTHYVRSGDFVVSLFRNAHNADELAFAVGALSHYIGDSVGHSEATNLAVPVEFPKLRRRYGPVVSYAEGEHQHVQTEFAFDIDQLAHHQMAPLSFQRHVGFKVPVHQLALAFYQTYGITDFAGYHASRFNMGEYRWAVRSLIPRVAFAITVLHRRHEPPEPNTPDTAEIDKEIAAVAAANHWDRYRRKAGFETYALACFLFVLPKVGPLAVVNVKGPTEQTEADYTHSLVLSTRSLRLSLHRFTPPVKGTASAAPHASPNAPIATARNQAAAPGTSAQPAPAAPLPVDTRRESAQPAIDPRHPLPNRDLDTGHVVQPGGYSLTDSTYASLLHRLTRTPQQRIPPGIVLDIQAYYADPNAPITTRRDPKRWAQVQADLKTLAAMPTNPEPEPYPTYEQAAVR
jgi:Zinc dependent phospholipase C